MMRRVRLVVTVYALLIASGITLYAIIGLTHG